MKIAGLSIGIALMILSGIGFVVCLALPSMTNNRINFQEAMLGLIPAALVLLMSAAMAVISLILMIKAKKKTPPVNGQR